MTFQHASVVLMAVGVVRKLAGFVDLDVVVVEVVAGVVVVVVVVVEVVVDIVEIVVVVAAEVVHLKKGWDPFEHCHRYRYLEYSCEDVV